MNSRLGLCVVVALLIGAAAGFFIGRTRSMQPPFQPVPRSQPTPAVGSGRVLATRTNDNQQMGLPGDDSSLSRLEVKLRQALARPFNRRWETIRDIARSVEPNEAAQALSIAEKLLPSQEFWNFRHALLEHWAEADPGAVLAYGQSLKNRNERQEAVSNALTEWARRDSDAALAWVEKLPRGQERQVYLSAALRGLAETDPQKALDKINAARFGERRWMRDQIIMGLAQKEPKTAAELAIKNSRGSRYGGWGEGQLGNVMQTWMRQDPDAAVAWFQQQPESVLKKQSVVQAIQTMGWQDPSSAMRLIELLPPTQQKEDALGNALSGWANRDLDALRAWTDSRSDPREKMLGQLAYAQGLATTDPAAAVTALQGIKPDERHSWQFQQVFNEYAQRDPQSAVQSATQFADSSARN